MQSLDPSAVSAASPNYLQEEILQRIPQGPVKMVLQLQVAGPGDAIDDPSIAWPASRRIVPLGVLRLTRVREDSETLEQTLLFNPAAVTTGIEPADPMIAARSAAYSVSYARRHSDAPAPNTGAP